MTFAAGMEARAEAVRYCTVAQARPSPFMPPATFLCASARAINEAFWNLREGDWAWQALRGMDREVFYFLAEEARLAAKAWRAAHGGQTIPQGDLARVISAAFWLLAVDPDPRPTWESQHENHRLTWTDAAGRVLAVAADWRARRAAA